MTVKNISIMEDVYRMLMARKKVSESFSELIRRTIQDKKDIMEFAGAWNRVSEEKISEIKINIQKARKKATKELSERIKRIHGNLS